MNLFALSWKNIVSKPLNSVMSVLLFALSVGLIVFLLLFNHQFKRGLDNNLAGIDLVIGAKGSPLQLILNSMYHVDNPTGNIPLAEAAPFLNPAHPLISKSIPLLLGDSYGGYRIAGAPQSILSLYNASEIEGEVYKADFEAVIGSHVAEKLHLHIGDEFYSTHGLLDDPDMAHDHGSPFIVKGILQQSGTILDQLILSTPQTIWKVHEHDTLSHEEGSNDHDHTHHDSHDHTRLPVKTIDSLQLKILSDSVVSQLRRSVDKEITSILVDYKHTNIQTLNFPRNINQNTGLMAASPVYEINRLFAVMGSGADAIRYLAIIIGIVAAASIFISLYNSLKERRYEMAMMRVAGAGPSKILGMILMEGLWISIAGLILGFLLGHLGMTLAGDMLEKNYRYAFTGWFWIREEWYIIVGALALGAIAALIPAIQGSKTNLHQTLSQY